VILSDREIRAALDRGAIRITPDPKADPKLWSSTSLDLRLGDELLLWDRELISEAESIIDLGPGFSPNEIISKYSSSKTIPEEGYVLRPNTFVLGWTKEKIALPHSSRYAARVEGKSSLARLGLGVHVTAPTIHAGFGFVPGQDANEPQGQPIQLEIWHIGPFPVRLIPGMKICQLIVEEVHGTPEQGYSGTFATQGPQG